MALIPAEDLTLVIEEFCDDHVSSVNDDNANYVFDVALFHNWCDATGNEAYKASVPDNATLRNLIAASAFPELAAELPG